jgi:hypothetical protein
MWECIPAAAALEAYNADQREGPLFETWPDLLQPIHATKWRALDPSGITTSTA